MKQEFKTIHGNEWETPPQLFNQINQEFNFTVDLACSAENCKCEEGLTYPDTNSLNVDWHLLSTGWMWLNPPYSPLKPWIQKAQQESRKGAKIVVLCPPILSTAYFSEVMPSEIRFLLGRVSFLQNKIPIQGNTKDSCLLIYGPAAHPKISYWNWRADR